MSDLLGMTGWVGQHPVTGDDVAHLLLYPATGLGETTDRIMALTAEEWGLADAMRATALPTTPLGIDLHRREIAIPDGGGSLPLPPLNEEWIAAATGQCFVVLTVTSMPLSVPGIADIDQLLADVFGMSGRVWSGQARVLADGTKGGLL